MDQESRNNSIVIVNSHSHSVYSLLPGAYDGPQYQLQAFKGMEKKRKIAPKSGKFPRKFAEFEQNPEKKGKIPAKIHQNPGKIRKTGEFSLKKAFKIPINRPNPEKTHQFFETKTAFFLKKTPKIGKY